jgi:hypothetical protein
MIKEIAGGVINGVKSVVAMVSPNPEEPTFYRLSREERLRRYQARLNRASQPYSKRSDTERYW